MKKIYGIAAVTLLAVSATSFGQNQPGGTMTPPGESMPTEPAPSDAPPPMPSDSAPPAPDAGTQMPPASPSGNVPPADTPPAGSGDAPAPTPAPADQTPVVTDASQTVAANVVSAERLSTLESAVVAAGLAETLGGAGPFTVFAPDNAAFTLVRPEALQQLMQPANRAQLANLLSAHVVPGRVTAADLVRQIEAGGGSATIETVGGDRLTARLDGQTVVLTGANNSRAFVTQADVNASNGVIHIINGLLLPSDG